MNSHLLREENLRAVPPQKQLSAVHPRAGKIADEGLSVGIQSKDQNDPTSLIFAQEASCSTTNHKHRHSFFVGFHVNTCTVSGVSFYIDLAAAHGISCRVADVSMNDDGATVHGIANGILRISGDLDSRTVQIGSQCIPRDTRNQDVPIPHACCNKSLPKAAGNSTVLVCCLKRTVQTAKIQMICFNMHIYTTPFFAFLHAESTRKL